MALDPSQQTGAPEITGQQRSASPIARSTIRQLAEEAERMLRISLTAALMISVVLLAPAHATFFWPQQLSSEECARRAEEGRQARAFLERRTSPEALRQQQQHQAVKESDQNATLWQQIMCPDGDQPERK